MSTVYISIGNSDDRLTQVQWHAFTKDLYRMVQIYGGQIHGWWHSLPHARWQNACVCFELIGNGIPIKERLASLAADYGQDSIAWAQVEEIEFIGQRLERP